MNTRRMIYTFLFSNLIKRVAVTSSLVLCCVAIEAFSMRTLLVTRNPQWSLQPGMAWHEPRQAWHVVSSRVSVATIAGSSFKVSTDVSPAIGPGTRGSISVPMPRAVRDCKALLKSSPPGNVLAVHSVGIPFAFLYLIYEISPRTGDTTRPWNKAICIVYNGMEISIAAARVDWIKLFASLLIVFLVVSIVKYLWMLMIKRRRRARWCCENCGYPRTVNSHICSECGYTNCVNNRGGQILVASTPPCFRLTPPSGSSA